MSNPEYISVRIRGNLSICLDQVIQISPNTYAELEAIWSSEDGPDFSDTEKFLELLDFTNVASVDYDDVDVFEKVESTE